MASSKEIKELRKRTGVGILDCKKALECNSTIEDAIQWLREKGISKGAAKAKKEAKEGVVVINKTESLITILEVNCETDFVARNNSFRDLAKKLLSLLQLHQLVTPNKEIEEFLNVEAFRLGEKIAIGKIKHYPFNPMEVEVEYYVHNDYQKAGFVVITKPINKETVEKIAMHIVAMNPLFTSLEKVPKDFIEKERNSLLLQLENDKKPLQIKERIVEGRLNKILSEIVLENQLYALAENKNETIKRMLQGAKIIDMCRFEVGVETK